MSDAGARWTTRPLALPAAMTLDTTGGGTLELGPPPAGEAWLIARLAVTTGGALVPEVRVYRNSARTENFVDGTSAGDADVSEYATPLRLSGGDVLVLVWTGGTAGARGSVTAQGTRERT